MESIRVFNPFNRKWRDACELAYIKVIQYSTRAMLRGEPYFTPAQFKQIKAIREMDRGGVYVEFGVDDWAYLFDIDHAEYVEILRRLQIAAAQRSILMLGFKIFEMGNYIIKVIYTVCDWRPDITIHDCKLIDFI